MRQHSLIACLLIAGLASGCTVLTSPVIAPVKAQNPSLSSPPAANDESPQPQETSPFPRLGNPTGGASLTVADYFADASNSVQVANVAITGGTDTDDDGALNYQVLGQVDLGPLGAHPVEILENDQPGASGRLDTYTVTDKQTDATFTLQLTPDNGNGILQSNEMMLSFLFTDDGKVSIDNGAPVTPEEGADLVAQFAGQSQVSPHALALLYARLLRTTVDTEEPTYTTTSYGLWVTHNRAFLEAFLLRLLTIYLGYPFLF